MPKRIYIINGKVYKESDKVEEFHTSGIDITYTKSRNMLSIGGWYDGSVGIENAGISLGEFFRLLGIKQN